MAEHYNGVVVDLTRRELMTVGALATTGIYNAAEIYVLIFATFRRRHGRYFWSMLVANSGILVYAVVSLVYYLAHGSGGSSGSGVGTAAAIVSGALALPAWIAMVTGQSVVLWCRLQLVVYSRRRVRFVLALIVTDACVLHLPMAVLWALSWAAPPPERAAWLRRYGVFERVAVVAFSLQETLIAGIFARQGFLNLKPLFASKARTAQLVYGYLLGLFVLVLLLDLGLVVLGYTNNAVLQTTSKPLVYSIKLKVEFIVLNKLLSFTKMISCDCHHVDDTWRGHSQGPMMSGMTATAKGLAQALGEGHSNNGLEAVPETERPDHIFDGSSVSQRGKQPLG